MEIVEYSSEHKIIASNSVILFDDKSDFSLHIKGNDTFSFVIKIIFEINEEGGISVKTDRNTNTITLIMHDSADKVGPSKSINVATVDDKDILFQFVVTKLYNGEYKKIDYTLFEG